MCRFEFYRQHLKDRIEERYKDHAHRSDEIIDHVKQTLEKNTPDDWRFTESATSRFFIVENSSMAKFMGMTYRDGPKCREIVSKIRKNAWNFTYLFNQLDSFAEDYMEELVDPDLAIVHEIRTVYPRKKGTIGEEKRVFQKTRSDLMHLIPLSWRKTASRPNAIVDEEGILWVRQYMNWVSMRQGSREYYRFHPLTKSGVDRSRCALFSHGENGVVKLHRILGPEKTVSDPPVGCSPGRNMEKEPGLRSENYWKVPTYLDRCLIDLTSLKSKLRETVSRMIPEEAEELPADMVVLMMLEMLNRRVRRKFGYEPA